MNEKLQNAYYDAVEEFFKSDTHDVMSYKFLEGFMLGLKEAISILEEREAGHE